MWLMGIDMGTSGCKAVVFDENWNVVYQAYREYPLIFPGEGLLELDAECVWQGIREAVTEANEHTDKEISAVAVSAIGDVIIPCTLDGTPVRNSIVDFDPRGEAELNAFADGFGKKRFFELTGMPPLFIGSLAKILWIKKNEPKVYESTQRWATYEDFIVQKLGLSPSVSYSEAARTMLFDIRKKTWAQELLTEVSIPLSKLPQAVPSAIKLGCISEKIQRELKFKVRAEVVSGGHDMVCAAVGAGLNESDTGTAVNIAGTIEGIVAAMDQPNTSDEMLENLFPCYPAHTGYVTFSVNLTAGCIVRWFRDMLAFEEYADCKQKGVNFYENLLKSIDTQTPGNIFFLPHFSGSGNPYFDPAAQGAIYGLTLDATRGSIARAMIEGLCYEIKLHTEAFKNAGMTLSALRAVGGGARIDAQLQLKANITGLTVIKGAVPESSALGAAAYAGVAMGVIKNPAEAFLAIKGNESDFSPDNQAYKNFDKAYARYKRYNEQIHSFEIEK
jgi:xylulokinase